MGGCEGRCMRGVWMCGRCECVWVGVHCAFYQSTAFIRFCMYTMHKCACMVHYQDYMHVHFLLLIDLLCVT